VAERPTLTTDSGHAGFPTTRTASRRVHAGPVPDARLHSVSRSLPTRNRERIPERGQPRPKGSGALRHADHQPRHHESIRRPRRLQSRAKDDGRLFLRFSTVGRPSAGRRRRRKRRRTRLSRGCGSTPRKATGGHGRYNTPIFSSCRDAAEVFPDFIHTQKRHPRTKHALAQPAMWDFWSLSPESLHQGHDPDCRIGGLPQRLSQHPTGFGLARLLLHQRPRTSGHWVKFHLQDHAGASRTWTNAEAAQKGRATIARRISATCSRRIEKGDFPNWKFSVQIIAR